MVTVLRSLIRRRLRMRQRDFPQLMARPRLSSSMPQWTTCAPFRTHRVVDGGVLPAVLHPFETGTEGNPFTGPVVGGADPLDLSRLRELTVSAVSAGMSPQRAFAQGHGFVVYDPTVCGWYLLALEEVADACAVHGRNADRSWAMSTANDVADAAQALLWSESDHLFGAYDVVGDRRLGGIGAMGLIPAAAKAMADRGLSASAADHHLRTGAPMWGRRGFAAGAVQAHAGIRDYVQWEGNAVWGATAYWAHLLALRSGRLEEAQRLRRELEDLIVKHGFREFYDAWTGEPGRRGRLIGIYVAGAGSRDVSGGRGGDQCVDVDLDEVALPASARSAAELQMWGILAPGSRALLQPQRPIRPNSRDVPCTGSQVGGPKRNQ